MKFFKWLDRFTPRQYRQRGNHQHRRARFIISLNLLSAIACIILACIFSGPLHFARGAALCLVGSLACCGIPLLLHSTNLDLAGQALLLIIFCLISGLNLAAGGWSGPLLVWLAFIPALAALLTRTQWTLLWVAVVLFQLMGLYWAHLQGLDHPMLQLKQIEVLNLLSTLSFLATLLILSSLFEQFESQTIRRLQRKNRQLAVARDRALEASQAKTSFLANMSHEFRTPLNAILGYSDMLLEENDLQEHHQRDLVRIRESGSHLLKLVNGLLDLSKIEAGKVHLEITTASLQGLMGEVQDTIRPLAQQQQCQVSVDLPGEILLLHTDVLKLKQCLLNILSNAAKFSPQGSVSIKARAQLPWLVVEVRDTGIGMTPEQMSQIFLPFAQADPSTTRRFGGTGLGLTLARRFAQMLGGDIAVSSQLGLGSTFTLTVLLQLGRTASGPEPTRKAIRGSR